MCGRVVGGNVGTVSWAAGFGSSGGFEAVSNHNKSGHYYYLHVTPPLQDFNAYLIETIAK